MEAVMRSRVSRLGRFGPWGRADPGELSLDGQVVRFQSDARGLLFEAPVSGVRLRVPKRYFRIGLTLIVNGQRHRFWFVPMTSMAGTRDVDGALNLGGNSFPLNEVRPAKDAVRAWTAMLQPPTG
jgi:hypothetical protein